MPGEWNIRSNGMPQAGCDILKEESTMKKQAFNPYLPTYEYIPDGEPRVFGDRLYVYGSHDRAQGTKYCENDYVCWSAPVDDLGNWRYEGVIFKKIQEPLYNGKDRCYLYAPDVVQGVDGRYYLYYSMENTEVISVAVCDTPAGQYEFLGHVHDENGYEPGSSDGDWIQFDPGVLVDDDGRVYLYSGFNPFFPYKPWRTYVGAYVMELKADMVTMTGKPKIIMPAQNKDLGNHNFFEASSIRKVGDTYYFVYSSQQCVELCYATSAYPDRDFTYRGTIISNIDVGVDGNTEPRNHGGNNHGGMVKIGEQWYIFYHRPTNQTMFSRQGSAEPIVIEPDGSIKQVEMTSCGLNGGPLRGEGTYTAGIVCNIFSKGSENVKLDDIRDNEKREAGMPYLIQDGEDIDLEQDSELNSFGHLTQGNEGFDLCPEVQNAGICEDMRKGTYVTQIRDGGVLGFKYFDIKDLKAVRVRIRGCGDGNVIISSNRADEADELNVIARIPVSVSDEKEWKDFCDEAKAEPGVYPLYISYHGSGEIQLQEFELIAK